MLKDRKAEVQVAATFVELTSSLKLVMEILGDSEIPVKRIIQEIDTLDKKYQEFISKARQFLKEYRGNDFPPVM